MKSFQHIAPPFRLFAGADSLSFLDRELQRLGVGRAVIVCGGTLSRSPLLDLVRGAAPGRIAGVFSGVKPHSPLPSVREGVGMLRQLAADGVIAVGGGSAVVTARAASILLAEAAPIGELATTLAADGRLDSPRLLAPKLPNFVVPTTPTTASVKAGTAVLAPDERRRFALFDPRTRAQAVFVHPDLMLSSPGRLAVSSSLDTLCMAIEGLMSRLGDPLAEAPLMQALRLLDQALSAHDGEKSAEIRGHMMMAAILAGQGTDFAGAGVATVLGHAIGATHETDNGIAKSIVLPAALRFNAGATEGLEKVAIGLGLAPKTGEMVENCIARIEMLVAPHGLPRRLRDLGIARDSIPAIAARGMADWFLRGNARPVREAGDLEKLLLESW